MHLMPLTFGFCMLKRFQLSVHFKHPSHAVKPSMSDLNISDGDEDKELAASEEGGYPSRSITPASAISSSTSTSNAMLAFTSAPTANSNAMSTYTPSSTYDSSSHHTSQSRDSSLQSNSRREDAKRARKPRKRHSDDHLPGEVISGTWMWY